MIRSTTALACLVLVLAACSREDAPPAAQAAPAADAAPAEITPPAVAAPAEGAPAAFDMRDYAGTFVAGGDRLELGPDGVYRVDEGGTVRDGTWTVEQGDTRVRLDPNSKSEPDRVLMMDGRDRLTVLDDAGRAAPDARAWTREAMPANSQ
jgi:copper homeostasis protein (lipoprotein)